MSWQICLSPVEISASLRLHPLPRYLSITIDVASVFCLRREWLSSLSQQDPVQLVDAMMPLYLNSQILRALQESLASELASRMEAMSNATSNAEDLGKSLSVSYNRERQAKITWEILEIVVGAGAFR